VNAGHSQLHCNANRYVDEANANIKKITDSKFLDNNKYKLNCGKQPTGFTIKLTSQRVKLSIKLKASQISTSPRECHQECFGGTRAGGCVRGGGAAGQAKYSVLCRTHPPWGVAVATHRIKRREKAHAA